MVSRAIGRLEEGLISLLLVGMTLLVFVEVILRFGFNTGFLWMQELTLLCSAWFVMLGASYGVKAGSHIGVDAIVRLLPTGLKRIVSIVAVLLCLAYCGILFTGSWVYLSKIYSIGLELEDMVFPKWVAHSILVIGFGLLALRFLELLWKMLKGEMDSFHLPDEAKEALEEVAHVDSHEGEMRK